MGTEAATVGSEAIGAAAAVPCNTARASTHPGAVGCTSTATVAEMSVQSQGCPVGTDVARADHDQRGGRHSG
jgi:hypothetical protein